VDESTKKRVQEAEMVENEGVCSGREEKISKRRARKETIKREG